MYEITKMDSLAKNLFIAGMIEAKHNGMMTEQEFQDLKKVLDEMES